MRVLAASMLAVTLLACASEPPPQKSYYLLRGDDALNEGVVRSDARVGIGRVRVAAYLDHLGLSLEVAPNEVRPARNHLWSEPLEDGLIVYLRGSVSAALGEEVGYRAARDQSWDQIVDVFFEQLHGTMTGRALIVATYHVIGPGDTLAEYRFRRSVELRGEGYGALVEAEKQLVSALGEAIAASVREAR